MNFIKIFFLGLVISSLTFNLIYSYQHFTNNYHCAIEIIDTLTPQELRPLVVKRNKVAALILIPLLWSILSGIPTLLPELKQIYIDGLVYDLALMLRAYSSAPTRRSDVVIIGIDEE